MKQFCLILLFAAFALTSYAQDDVLYDKLVNALACVDQQTIDESQRVDEYIEKQFRLGNYSEVLRHAKSHLQGRMSMLNQMYFAMSEQERADMSILIDGDLIFHYILSSAVHSNNNEIMGDVYDYLLFIKQLQLRTSRQISNAIKQSNNKQLLYICQGYNDIQKQLAQSNPPSTLNRDSLQNLMNRAGRVLARECKPFLTPDVVSWRDIQKRLGNGESALEFVRFNVFKGENITSLYLYAAIVVTQTCKTPKLILMNTEKNLTYWQTDNPSDLYDVNKYGAVLSQWIWLDILTYLDRQGITTIYFAPFGILNNIAIESLPYDRENPMSWHYNFTRLSSTRELATKHNPYPQKTAALYGDLSYRLAQETNQLASSTRSAVSPLPWSKNEIDSITHILSNGKYSITTYAKKQGTEASFKALDGKSPSILHTATHGFVNRQSTDDVMQQSGLILSYGARAWERKPIEPGTEDGLLTSAEIAVLDLSRTDVVVLSACNTALGEVTPEGVWGLQRAFKQAGVQTVIMSLWHVDDVATAVFMQYFYEELMKGRRGLDKIINVYHADPEHAFDYAQEALQMAQHRMRQHPQYSSPYYWAAFIAID